MQLAAVEILEELLELARRIHIAEVWKEIHVLEGIDGDQGQVVLRFAQVMQRMGESFAISGQKVDILCEQKRKSDKSSQQA